MPRSKHSINSYKRKYSRRHRFKKARCLTKHLIVVVSWIVTRRLVLVTGCGIRAFKPARLVGNTNCELLLCFLPGTPLLVIVWSFVFLHDRELRSVFLFFARDGEDRIKRVLKYTYRCYRVCRGSIIRCTPLSAVISEKLFQAPNLAMSSPSVPLVFLR